MRLVLLTSFALLITGCDATTGSSYSKTVNSWRGGHSSDLLRVWGKPTITTNSGDKVVYIYRQEFKDRSQATYSPSVGVHPREEGGAAVVTTPPTVNTPLDLGPTLYCVTVFTATSQGKITNTSTEGAGCALANAKGASS